MSVLALARRRVPVITLLCFLGAPVAQAEEQDQAREIRHSTVIDEPGSYTLRRDLRTSESRPLITIRANNVTLDLNGHALIGPGNRRGIGVLIDRATSVEVRNGSVSGFGEGVHISGSVNARIEQLRISGEDLGGTPPDIEVGIMIVNSKGVVVTENTITRTFLGIFVRGGESGGNRIAKNTLTAGLKGALGICYNPAPNEGPAGPRGDLVYNNLVSRFATGVALSVESQGNIIRENDIAYIQTGIVEASPGNNVLSDNTTVQTFL